MAMSDASGSDVAIGNETDSKGRLLTSDGRPLRAALERANRRRKLTAFGLVAPLLAFILIFFAYPIMQMMMRSVDNPAVVNALPQTLEALESWDGQDLPGEDVYAALYRDMMADKELPRREQKIGPLAVRLNYEISAARGAISRTARTVDEFEAPYKEAFMDAHRLWNDTTIWQIIQREGRPLTASYYVAALDREYNAEGEIVSVPENRQIYVSLFGAYFLVEHGHHLHDFRAGFSDCLLPVQLADEQSKPADDRGAAALLDVALGAHKCVDCPASGARGYQRDAGRAWVDRRRRAPEHDL